MINALHDYLLQLKMKVHLTLYYCITALRGMELRYSWFSLRISVHHYIRWRNCPTIHCRNTNMGEWHSYNLKKFAIFLSLSIFLSIFPTFLSILSVGFQTWFRCPGYLYPTLIPRIAIPFASSSNWLQLKFLSPIFSGIPFQKNYT